MKKFWKLLSGVVVLAVLAAGGIWAYKICFTPKSRTVFRTDRVERQTLTSTISATGTVEPEELVNVGSQISGMITEFGLDTDGKSVDYGSTVTAGMVLARIDDSLYEAEARQYEAQKLEARANIVSAEANIKQAQAKLDLAELNWERAQQLQPSGVLAKSDYDDARSTYFAAVAALAVSKASLEQANASLAGAEAALNRANRNLGYCVISSPVDGVIIDRRVSIGQTVAASMNTPSLFLIAKDLKKMQVWVSVNEADIGQIEPGIPVTFTVDTFPDVEFRGVVQKIRLNATMSQNVVTYVVEVGTDNSDGKLLPYLTANVKFILKQRENVLSIPNAALRFSPEDEMVPPQYRNFQPGEGERVVWVLEQEQIRPVTIRVGLNDGIATEVIAGELQEAMQVVTGTEVVSAATDNAGGNSTSPFLPKPPSRRR